MFINLKSFALSALLCAACLEVATSSSTPEGSPWVTTYSRPNPVKIVPSHPAINKGHVNLKNALKTDLLNSLIQLKAASRSKVDYMDCCTLIYDSESFCTYVYTLLSEFSSAQLWASLYYDKKNNRVSNVNLENPLEDFRELDWVVDSVLNEYDDFVDLKENIENMRLLLAVDKESLPVFGPELNRTDEFFNQSTGNAVPSELSEIVRDTCGQLFPMSLKAVTGIATMLVDQLKKFKVPLPDFLNKKDKVRLSRRGLRLASASWLLSQILYSVFHIAFFGSVAVAGLICALLISVAESSLALYLLPEFYIFMILVASLILFIKRMQVISSGTQTTVV